MLFKNYDHLHLVVVLFSFWSEHRALSQISLLYFDKIRDCCRHHKQTASYSIHFVSSVLVFSFGTQSTDLLNVHSVSLNWFHVMNSFCYIFRNFSHVSLMPGVCFSYRAYSVPQHLWCGTEFHFFIFNFLEPFLISSISSKINELLSALFLPVTFCHCFRECPFLHFLVDDKHIHVISPSCCTSNFQRDHLSGTWRSFSFFRVFGD